MGRRKTTCGVQFGTRVSRDVPSCAIRHSLPPPQGPDVPIAATTRALRFKGCELMPLYCCCAVLPTQRRSRAAGAQAPAPGRTSRAARAAVGSFALAILTCARNPGLRAQGSLMPVICYEEIVRTRNRAAATLVSRFRTKPSPATIRSLSSCRHSHRHRLVCFQPALRSLCLSRLGLVRRSASAAVTRTVATLRPERAAWPQAVAAPAEPALVERPLGVRSRRAPE